MIMSRRDKVAREIAKAAKRLVSEARAPLSRL